MHPFFPDPKLSNFLAAVSLVLLSNFLITIYIALKKATEASLPVEYF